MKELWDRHKANIGLAVLVIYTLSLGVATADEVFRLGLFKTKLEKMIGGSIDKFDSTLTSEREQARKDIIEYGDFAVPQLVGAVGRDGETSKTAMECLTEITDQTFDDPAQWREWYSEHKEEFK